MNDPHIIQLTDYLNARFAAGADKQALVQQLLSMGWQQPMIDQAMRGVKTVKPTDPKRVQSAMLWVFSPIILWCGTGLVQLLLSLLGVDSVFIDTLALWLFIVGVPLAIIGPIVGIIKLIKKG